MSRLLKSSVLEGASRWLLVMVFLYAGVPKFLNMSGFASTIGAYDLLPEYLLLPAAAFLSTAELVGAFALALRKKWGLLVVGALLLLFILVLSYGLAMGYDIDCGCFGEEDPEHRAFAGLRTALVRDVMLLLPLCYLWFRSFVNIEQEKVVSL